jgi:uncharacterized protein (TIGR00251 family)
VRITVKAKTRAKTETVTLADGIYTVAVKAQPVDGKANEAIIKAIAAHFKVAPSKVSIVSGHTAKLKIVDIGL